MTDRDRDGNRGSLRQSKRRDWPVAAALLVLGLCLILPFWQSPPRWYVDSLYYEAHKLEVMGAPRETALREAFGGEMAASLRGRLPSGERRAEYARFYDRRWTVPVLAAGLDPAFGTASLRDASLLGWAVLAPLLFLLLRRRFAIGPSAAAACLAMFLPPLLHWAPAPLVDSWGVSMLTAGFLLALLAREDLRWLPVWIVVVLVGSVTRDVGVILLPATAWLALRERSRRMGLVTATGVLASIPAPLLFTAPLRQNLAYLVNDSHLPAQEAGWSWILARYPGAVLDALRADLEYPLHAAPLYALLALAFLVPVAVGLWLLFRSGDAPLLRLMRAAAVCAAVPLLLSPNYTGLRLELVLVPAIATGLALAIERYPRRFAVAPPPAPAPAD